METAITIVVYIVDGICAVSALACFLGGLWLIFIKKAKTDIDFSSNSKYPKLSTSITFWSLISLMMAVMAIHYSHQDPWVVVNCKGVRRCVHHHQIFDAPFCAGIAIMALGIAIHLAKGRLARREEEMPED